MLVTNLAMPSSHSRPFTIPPSASQIAARANHAAGRASHAAVQYQAAKHGASHARARSAKRQTALRGGTRLRIGREPPQPEDPHDQHVDHDDRLPPVDSPPPDSPEPPLP